MNTDLLSRKIAQLKQRNNANIEALEAIHHWLLEQNEIQRIRINPYSIVQDTGIGIDSLMPEILHSVPLGLFDLYWDVHCPYCNMCTVEYGNLSSATAASHCRMCDVGFDVDFARQVEVTFSLNREIEHIEVSAPCPIPPSLNPRYSFGLFRGNSTAAEEVITAGVYRYFCPITTAKGVLTVTGPETSEVQVFHVSQLDGPHYDIEAITAQPGPIRFEVDNMTHHLSGFYLISEELAALPPQEIPLRLSGLDLIHFPTFWHLFSDQVLSRRERLQIAAVTTVFTDITGSTQMYEKLGDVVAYNIVRDHFEILFQAIEKHNGTILKTIGDAVMASFISNEQAAKAVLEALAQFEIYNRGQDVAAKVNIKIGLHRGPAILVNLNDTLDYFGLTINKAARIQGQARSNEILFSEEVYEDEAFRQALAEAGVHPLEKQLLKLRGITEHQVVFKAAVGKQQSANLATEPSLVSRFFSRLVGQTS